VSTANSVERIRNDLLLAGLLAIFVGIVSTEAYYIQFGMRHVTLAYPIFQIVFRGLTAILNYPYILSVYFFGVIFQVLEPTIAQSRRSAVWHPLSTGIAAITILILAYYLSVKAGEHMAAEDLTAGTSSIPRIALLELDQSTYTLSDDLRLLLESPDEIVVFKPSADLWNAHPVLRHIRKGDVHALEVSP
jgi:hypothetical protein